MLTVDDLRAVLVDCAALGLPADLGDDTPFVIDSFALVWITHVLNERHGFVIDQRNIDPEAMTSVRAMFDHLAVCHPDAVALDEAL